MSLATSKTWTYTLDPDPEKPVPRKTWTLKNLDPEKPGPGKTWTLKNLGLEKPGRQEKCGKQLDAVKRLKDHIV